MKKFIYLTALLFAFTSCSSEEDGINYDSNAVDLIVGVWKPVSEIQVVNGVQETDSYSCGEVITFTFLENGNYTRTLFSQDDDNNCIENTEYNITGT